MDNEILVERDTGLVTVTINRPDRKNAMTHANWARLREIFTEIGDRIDDRVVVVTGAGGDFCAGADLVSADLVSADLVSAGEGERRSALADMRLVGQAAHAVHALPKPTIAKVDGVAVGAGCNLALCCDLVVASDRARFSQIFARRGLSLDFGGSWLLPRIVGSQRAKQLAFLADIVDASTALRYGLVNEVVPAAELDAFVADWAARILAGPPMALSMTKTQLDAAWSLSFAEALEAEAQVQASNLNGQDATEAFAAFREKRAPKFVGR